MSKGKGHIPIRTCICCRARRGRNDLLRLVLDADGMVVPDAGGRKPGRGAYVCRDAGCLSLLHKINRLQRVFRTKRPVALHPDLFGLSPMPEAFNGKAGAASRL